MAEYKCKKCNQTKSRVGTYCKKCMGEIYRGKNHHSWVGDKAKYMTVHHWIEKEYGKPGFCEVCGTEKARKFEWANISGKYERSREDFLRMCTSCHRKYDKSYQHILKSKNYYNRWTGNWERRINYAQ